jgi:hypothetical protein
MKLEFFPYWLGFFVFVEGGLFLALVYVLVLTVRHSLAIGSLETKIQAQPEDESEERDTSESKNILKMAFEGIIGNTAFYLFMVVALIVFKLTGVVDAVIDAILVRLLSL